jgi:pyruvate,water dikinase
LDPIAVRAAAIVTNEGGSTCHAIRVANERGFPAVVGTEKATTTIRDGEQVLVDTTEAFVGRVYRAT